MSSWFYAEHLEVMLSVWNNHFMGVMANESTYRCDGQWNNDSLARSEADRVQEKPFYLVKKVIMVHYEIQWLFQWLYPIFFVAVKRVYEAWQRIYWYCYTGEGRRERGFNAWLAMTGVYGYVSYIQFCIIHTVPAQAGWYILLSGWISNQAWIWGGLTLLNVESHKNINLTTISEGLIRF